MDQADFGPAHLRRFTATFTAREIRIINNFYIVAVHYNYTSHIDQIKSLAIRYGFKLDYKFNSTTFNIELYGYCSETVRSYNALDVINVALANAHAQLMRAIYENNINNFKKYMCYGINLNSVKDGRLALELACQHAGLEIIKILLADNTDVVMYNSFGINALMQSCKYGKVDVLKELFVTKEDNFVDFLDVEGAEYETGRDIIRLVIDTDEPEFMRQILMTYSGENYVKVLDSEDFQKMYNYACRCNKMLMAKYLNEQKQNSKKVEEKLIESIEHIDLPQVILCIEKSVNFNKKINSKYPVVLACELSAVEIVLHFITDTSVEWYTLDQADEDDYNVELDLSLIAIKNDDPEIISLMLCDDSGNYNYKKSSLLFAIYNKSYNLSKPKVMRYVQNLIKQQENKEINLFAAAVSGDINEINIALQSGVDINSRLKVNGKTIFHVLCEYSHCGALQNILGIENVDPNIADINGDYPVSIACRGNNFEVLDCLLRSEVVRVNDFSDEFHESYVEKLDVLKEIIVHDNIDLFESVVKFAQTQQRLIYTNQSNMRILHEFAISKNASQIIIKLNQYIALLQTQSQIFNITNNKSELNLSVDGQGVQCVESSFITSIKRLCKRYDIKVIAVENEDYKKLYGNYNWLEILKSMQSVIAATKNPQYMLVNNKSAHVTTYASDSTYRDWATATLERLISSIEASSNIWYSSWYNEGSEKRELNQGLTMGEIWCLAILAARDPMAISTHFFDEYDIKERERLLVDTLVECHRAYIYDKEYKDIGGNARQSCDHGVAVRSMLALSHLHDDITIVENPLDWAHSVAQETLIQLFKNSEYYVDLSQLLKKHKFQYTPIESAIVDAFYADAKIKIEEKLIDEIGLVTHNGHLTIKALQDILERIIYIELPIVSIDSLHVTVSNYHAKTYSLVNAQPFLIQSGIAVQQYKLPFSADSMFAAILISALDCRKNLVHIRTVSDLRNIVTSIIESAIMGHHTFDAAIAPCLQNCIYNPNIVPVFRRSIIQRFNTLYPDSDERFKVNYFHSLRQYGQPDSLAMIIISALYGCPIICFDLQGKFLSNISGAPFFLIPKFEDTLNVCCGTIFENNISRQDRNVTNALVRETNWKIIFDNLDTLNINDAQMQIDADEHFCDDYVVMISRGVDQFDQIKIPVSCYSYADAALTAAKYAGIIPAFSVNNAAELLGVVQAEVMAVYGILELHNELETIARILGITINLHIPGNPSLLQFNTSVNAIPVYLLQSEQHFNLLVPRGTWSSARLATEEHPAPMVTETEVQQPVAKKQRLLLT